MNASRCSPFLAALAVMAAMTCVDAAPPPALTVTHVTRDGQPASAADVVLRALDGHVLRNGIRTGESLPDDVRVEVPPHTTVTLASPSGKSTITLQPGAVATFHYTGSVESVAIAAGKVSVDDSLGFFRLSARDGLEVKAKE